MPLPHVEAVRSLFRDVPRRPVFLLVVALTSAAIALGLVSVSARRTYRTLEAAAAQRQTAYEFLMALRQLRQHVGEARVGLTGYALTQDSLYRTTYASGIGGLGRDTTVLRELARGRPTLQGHLDRLGPVLTAYADAIGAAMLAAERGTGPALSRELRRTRDAVLLENFRAVIVSLEREQVRLMEAGAREVAGAVRRSRAIIAGVVVVGVVLILSASGAVFVQLVGRERAEREIRQLNAVLEARVAERTAQLEAANKELEAFAYSVSHDLRAPLRAIAGFSRAMVEDFGATLDPRAREYLHYVASAAHRMGELIHDLLEFSKAGRAELSRSRVSLSDIAHSVVRGLQRLEPARQVEVTIEDGLDADADAQLMRVVLENLLGNSWKFTTRAAPARIEVGSEPSIRGAVYFVRDNGTGFDMTYVDKLFQPFQRLHGTDFPGTGIGLATVQRIIDRHGGRVWAQGMVGGGATFCFTIPPLNVTTDF